MKILPIVLGTLALVTAGPAWMQDAQVNNDASNQIPMLVRGGKEIAPEQIAGLRVVTWDDSAQIAKRFEVKKSGGSWIIPSHYDYPADGGTRVGKTAGGVLNVIPGRLVTTDPAQYDELGVVDPLTDASGMKKGRGKRVTLTDQTGATVVDLIIGNQVPDAEGMYFVRDADSKQVYTAKVGLDISTQFIDWVETDLLKVRKDDLRKIGIVDVVVDADAHSIVPRGDTLLEHKSASAEWMAEPTPVGKRLSKDVLDKMLEKITSLKLVGIRPFDLMSLRRDGFFVDNTPQLLQQPNALLLNIQGQQYALFSNEGRIDVVAKNGIVYSMVFGNVSVDDESADPGPEGKPKQDKNAAVGHNRFMTVFVRYDRSYDEEAQKSADQAAQAAKESAKDPKKEAGKNEDKSESISKANQELASRLQPKFLKFFYVIGDDSFTTMKPATDKLFEAKPKEPQAGTTGKTNKDWLAANGKKPGVTTTATGLEYEVLSNGPANGRHPIATDEVSVMYKGTLIDGQVFDASKNPTNFRLNAVVKGWTEALQLMSPGDKWKIYLPPELAYGEAGQKGGKVPIGANEILTFEVELLKILTPPAPGAAVETPAPAHPTAESTPAPTPTPPAKPEAPQAEPAPGVPAK